MNINELHSFKLSDAVAFHDRLNPKLWQGNTLRPDVRSALLAIAQDFTDYLGISDLDVLDITISGSNAAYSYTKHSDIDLHLLVDMSKLDPDQVYRELFSAKKNMYNADRDIKIHGIEVECYVQDSQEPAVTLGEYSVADNRWLKIPAKRRATISHREAGAKFDKLRRLAELAEVSGNSKLIDTILRKIREYRQAGLSSGGEFSPENIAYKALRSQGILEKLYKLRERVRGRELSIENMYATEGARLDKPTPTVAKLADKHGVTQGSIKKELARGIEVEQEHTTSKQTAREIALDHLGEDPRYYTKLATVGLEEASGYVPSPSESGDPRWKTALSVDVNPYSIQDNARRLGSRIARDGRPPLLRGRKK